jgi:hypothetical protein
MHLLARFLLIFHFKATIYCDLFVLYILPTTIHHQNYTLNVG